MEFQIVKNKYQRRQEKKNTNANQFQKLPDEIIAHIFSFISEGEDLLDCAKVCTRFNEVIKATPHLLEFKEQTRQYIINTFLWSYKIKDANDDYSDDDHDDYYDVDKPTYEYKGQTYYYDDRN